jgi:hypothetical protein
LRKSLLIIRWFAVGIPLAFGIAASCVYIPVPGSNTCLQRLAGQSENSSDCLVAIGLASRITVAQIKVRGVAVPSLVLRPNFVQPTAVLVNVIGGPGNQLTPTMFDPMTLMLAQFAVAGVVVIEPAYLGTYHRSLHPEPSISAASSEVALVAEWASRNISADRKCLLGISLGGYIIGVEKSRTKSKEISDYPSVLLNPQLNSPEIRLRNAINKNFYKIENGRRIFTPRYVYRATLFKDAAGNQVETQILSEELYKSFYGPFLDFDVSRALQRREDIAILYSANDKERSAENIDAYRIVAGNSAIALPTRHHVIWEDESLSGLEQTVISAIWKCLGEKGGARRPI